MRGIRTASEVGLREVGGTVFMAKAIYRTCKEPAADSRRGRGTSSLFCAALLAMTAAAGHAGSAQAESWNDRLRAIDRGAQPDWSGWQGATLQIAQAGEAQSFAIDAQPLTAALDAFSDQTGLSFAYTTSQLEGVDSNGVTGTFTPREALSQLLAGTGVTFRFTGAQTVSLTRASPRSGEDDVLELDPITVEGEGGSGGTGYRPPAETNVGIDPFGSSIREIPATVNVIPQQFIEDRAPRRLSELADYLPGVNLRETNGGTGNNGVIIRGFSHGGGNEVSLNGQVQRIFNNQSRGFANIERVEVLKGSAGVEAGVVEPGGVVNLVTKKPQRDAALVVSGEVGSYELFGATVDATGPLTQDGTLLYRFIAEGQTRESFRDNFDQDRVLVAPSLQWDYAEGSSALLELEYIFQDQAYDRGIFYLEDAGFDDDFAPIEFSSHEPDDSLKSHSGRASLSVDQRLTDVFSLRGRATYIIEDYLSKGARNPNLNGLYIPGTNRFSGNPIIARSFTKFDGKSEQFLTDAEALAGFETGPLRHDMLIGLEYAYAENENQGQDGQTVWPLNALDPVYGTPPQVIGRAEDGVGRDFDSVRKESYRSLYGQYKLTAWDRFHLLGGLRFDDAEFSSRFTRNVNTDATGPRTKFGDEVVSWRVGAAVDVTEAVTLFGGISNASVPQSGQDRQGGAFEPLESLSYDAGVKVGLFGDRALFTVSVFDITQENLTEPDPDNLPGENFSALIGEVNSRGVELELSGAITDRFDVLAGAAFLDTEITESTSGQKGNRLFGVPEFQASIWGKYDFSDLLTPGLSAALGVVYVGEREGDNDNSFELPAYTRVDAGLFYDWRNVGFSLAVENLFDTTYYVGSQNRPTAVTPGAPINVLAGVSVRF